MPIKLYDLIYEWEDVCVELFPRNTKPIDNKPTVVGSILDELPEINLLYVEDFLKIKCRNLRNYKKFG